MIADRKIRPISKETAKRLKSFREVYRQEIIEAFQKAAMIVKTYADTSRIEVICNDISVEVDERDSNRKVKIKLDGVDVSSLVSRATIDLVPTHYPVITLVFKQKDIPLSELK